MSQFLIDRGIVFIVAGVLFPLVRKLGLGRLPGDIAVVPENLRVFIALGTAILIGIVPTPIFWPIDR